MVNFPHTAPAMVKELWRRPQGRRSYSTLVQGSRWELSPALCRLLGAGSSSGHSPGQQLTAPCCPQVSPVLDHSWRTLHSWTQLEHPTLCQADLPSSTGAAGQAPRLSLQRYKTLMSHDGSWDISPRTALGLAVSQCSVGTFSVITFAVEKW